MEGRDRKPESMGASLRLTIAIATARPKMKTRGWGPCNPAKVRKVNVTLCSSRAACGAVFEGQNRNAHSLGASLRLAIAIATAHPKTKTGWGPCNPAKMQNSSVAAATRACAPKRITCATRARVGRVLFGFRSADLCGPQSISQRPPWPDVGVGEQAW